MKFAFKTQAQQDIFLKTRVEQAGVPEASVKTLLRSNIRTIGGVISREESELKSLLEESDVDYSSFVSSVSSLADKIATLAPLPPTEISGDSRAENTKAVTGTLFAELKKEEDVVATLAAHFGHTKAQIVKHSRKKDLVRVRDMITYLMRTHGDMSFPSIGRLLDRDHTTIIHSVRKMEKIIAAKPDLEKGLEKLTDHLHSIKARKILIEKKIIPALLPEIVKKIRMATFKEIPERDMRILDMYREGLTLANIALPFRISRERARQVVIGTIKQLAINDSIEKGITIDVDVIKEEEARTRKQVISGGKEKPVKEKRWSTYYIACKSCGTTSLPHVRKGLCEKCSSNYRGDRRERFYVNAGNKCQSCGMSRADNLKENGRDLYITKEEEVLCRGCFLKSTGTKLGGYRNYEWSRHYPSCVSCGTTSTPHVKKGLCATCARVITEETKLKTIADHNHQCDKCHITQSMAEQTYDRGLYLTKTGDVLCRQCFQSRLTDIADKYRKLRKNRR